MTNTPTRPDRAPVAQWLDPLVSPPPRGTKLMLLTSTEVATIGHWADADCIAWAPLPQKPDWIRHRLREMRARKAEASSLCGLCMPHGACQKRLATCRKKAGQEAWPEDEGLHPQRGVAQTEALDAAR